LKKIVIATSNPGKLNELQAMLGPLGIETIAQSAFNIADAEEPHDTFLENALVKARHASRATGLAALADDSGLCVESLGGDPGVHSAYYAGREGGRHERDPRNNTRLVSQLRDQINRCAFYYCVLVLVHSATDPTPLVAEGRWHGEIVLDPRGEGGFGYDPHFVPRGSHLTAAQMPAEEKNRASHRAQALAALARSLRAA